MISIEMIQNIIGSEYNLEQLIQSINVTIEHNFPCKIYNKEILLEYCINNNNMENIINMIYKNIISCITYEKFKNMGFSIIFVNDKVNVLYNNTLVLSGRFNKMFEHDTEQVLNLIIEKLLNNDINVIFHCIDIPIPYLSLLTLKNIKNNGPKINKELENIVNGIEYKKVIEPVEEVKENIQDPMDEIYRLEVMSHLDDEQIIIYLEYIEKITEIEKTLDNNNTNQLVSYIKMMLDYTCNFKNKVGKIYFANKLFKTLTNVTILFTNNPHFRKTVLNKIEEFQHESYITKELNLNLSTDFLKTLVQTYEHIINLNKN